MDRSLGQSTSLPDGFRDQFISPDTVEIVDLLTPTKFVALPPWANKIFWGIASQQPYKLLSFSVEMLFVIFLKLFPELWFYK